MKTELRLSPHSILPGQQVIEIWFAGEFIGQVTAATDGPGVRVISKHRMTTERDDEMAAAGVVTVRISKGPR